VFHLVQNDVAFKLRIRDGNNNTLESDFSSSVAALRLNKEEVSIYNWISGNENGNANDKANKLEFDKVKCIINFD
jgi:hypothetical protein